MIKCVILDLDQTIVDSEPIKRFRENGDWSNAYAHFGDCRTYDGVNELFTKLRNNGIFIAVATNSPSQYAHKLLNRFKLKADCVIGYHDVIKHKPASDCIEKIISQFRLTPDDVIYVGDDDFDHECAESLNVQFLAVQWGTVTHPHIPKINFRSLSCHIFLKNEDTVKRVVEKNILRNGSHYFLGYYDDHIRAELLDFKEGNEISLAQWTAVTINNSGDLPRVDYVVRSLGHAETKISSSPIDVIGNAISKQNGAKYVPELLTKLKPTLKSTSLKRHERFQQIKNTYDVNSEVINGKNFNPTFLILDDIYTTGATTNEIKRALTAVFPLAEIHIFTLAKTLYGDSISEEMRYHNNLLYRDLTFSSQNKATPRIRFNRNNSRLTQKCYSANYSYTNHNFIIQNLPSYSIEAAAEFRKYIPGLYILRNILQRGKPTLLSRYLQEHFGPIHKRDDYRKGIPLIGKRKSSWARTIKGCTKTNYNPAKIFFDKLLPKHLGEFGFVRELILPEATIYDITRVYVEDFYDKRVDFYLPQAGLIIEIDGKQHLHQITSDFLRDTHTKKYGINTIRFSSEEIASENESFHQKMTEVLDVIHNAVSIGEERKKQDPSLITLLDYKAAYENTFNGENPLILVTAIMRMQLLLLDLLETGRLSFNTKWDIEIRDHDSLFIFDLASKDLSIWLENILALQNISYQYSEPNIRYVKGKDRFSNNTNAIKIDFSLTQRFTDEFQTNPHIIYVRTHYIDEYRYFDEDSLSPVKFCNHDFFKLSTIDPVDYNLTFSEKSTHRENLLFFLRNVFLPYLDDVDFREGQLAIITSALSLKDTIGLLPTGSGKSICYQLSAILQPAISFVVCPIKSLMYDQKSDLDQIMFTRTNYLTSDLAANQKSEIQMEYGQGKYFFIFISPERFQTKTFRRQLSQINIDKSFAYAVIDEVHCLSEWGHDFRTSYLNLANTIRHLSSESTYIGLTATASVNVLKDIQNEFRIPNENVKTPLDFTRKELRFDVIDDQAKKERAIVKLLEELDSKWNHDAKKNTDKKCGIIFTPHVNGDKGCYNISLSLSNALKTDVRYFSGSKPRDSDMSDQKFDEFKINVQSDFKNNLYHLLVATKAFGMGVNKGNIAYTIHYGIPGSMEALYQEAGRAGRDKSLFCDNPSDCYVLLTKDPKEKALNTIWEPTVTVDELKELLKRTTRNSDINTNLYMLLNSLDSVNNESKLIYLIYMQYCSLKDANLVSIVRSRDLNSTKQKVEKAIYRLMQLGIIEDWTVEDFFAGIFEITINKLTTEQIRNNLEKSISKYDEEFTLDEILTNPSNHYRTLVEFKNSGRFDDIRFYFLILLLWSYEHFAYNRRQSLKNVYEQCSALATGKITHAEFKNALESYFRFNETSHILQHIADKPHDYERWFNVFYTVHKNKRTDQLIDASLIGELKEQLSRFLESYMNNVGLDLLSGLVRLALNDFDDADGRQRFVSALKKIKKYEKDITAYIIEQIIRVTSRLSHHQKGMVVESMYHVFNETAIIDKLYRNYGDDVSLSILLKYQGDRLAEVSKKLKEFRW